MKKILFIAFVFLFCLLPFSLKAEENVSESEEYILKIYVFTQKGCLHCDDLMKYLESEKEAKNIEIEIYEEGTEEYKKKEKIQEKFNLKKEMPLYFLGRKYYIGFSKIHVPQLAAYIDYCLLEKETDLFGKYFSGEIGIDDISESDNNENCPTKYCIDRNQYSYELDLPFLGKTNIKKTSLLLLSILMGLADGVNPCAMWALLLLISMLIPTGNKKRIWLLGGVFILTSGIFYFILMLSWGKIAASWVDDKVFRIIAGICIFLLGAYNIYKFIKASVKKEEGCEVTDASRKQKIAMKLKAVISGKSIALSVIGIVGISIMVNLIELACSLGMPAVYTLVLDVNKVSPAMSLLYTFIYVLMFLLDDIIVFTIAACTLRLTGISNKIGKYSNLIGGILMITIAVLLIFFIEILRFSF